MFNNIEEAAKYMENKILQEQNDMKKEERKMKEIEARHKVMTARSIKRIQFKNQIDKVSNAININEKKKYYEDMIEKMKQDNFRKRASTAQSQRSILKEKKYVLVNYTANI